MKPLIKSFSRVGAITIASLLLLQIAAQSTQAAKTAAPFNPAIVYRIEGNSANYICMTDSSGSSAVVLAKTTQFREYLHNPLWTPDGKQVIFKRVLHDPARVVPPKVIDCRLWIINRDGTGLRELCMLPQLEGRDPALTGWLPDSSKIVLYTFLGDGFYTFDPFVPTTPPIKQENPTSVRLSGEGSQFPPFTFSLDISDEPGFQGFIIGAGRQIDANAPEKKLNDLWKIPVAEDSEGRFVFGTPIQITDTPFLDEFCPSLSPDGSRATVSYFAFPEDIQALDMCSVLTGETVSLAAKEPYGASTWAPDGKHVAFRAIGRTAHMEIFRVSTDGTRRLVSLTPKSADATASDANWNPAWVNDIDP